MPERWRNLLLKRTERRQLRAAERAAAAEQAAEAEQAAADERTAAAERAEAERAAAREHERRQCEALLPKFRQGLAPNASIREAGLDGAFMYDAASRLAFFELPSEWESRVDHVRTLFRRRAQAHVEAGRDADVRALPESREITALGEELGREGGGYLMILVAHRAQIKHGTRVRVLEHAWDGICGWMN